MPATYSHKARPLHPLHPVRKRTYQAQEIAGVMVDARIVEQYLEAAFYIQGIPCSWNLVETGAMVASGKMQPTSMTKDPAFCEACLERYTAERNNLIRYNGKKGLDPAGKPITRGEEQMNNTPRTASDFIDELEGIYRASRAIYNRLQEKVDNARAAMNAAHKAFNESTGANRQIAEARYTIAKDALKNAEDAFRKDVYELGKSHDAKVAELRQRFNDHLNEHYSASPDKLDAATMQLLNAGICTPVELARLAERHKDNPTMLRIVAGYADKIADNRNQSHENYMTCRSIAMMASRVKDGSREMNVFDSAVTSLRYGIQNDPATANRMHEYISGWFDDYREQMDNLPNIPVDLAPDTGGDDRGE